MVHKRKLRNAKQTKKVGNINQMTAERKDGEKLTTIDDINATRRHIIKSKHIDVKHSFSDYEVLSARAHAHGDQKRNSHFNSNAWIPFHKRPQFTQLIYIYRFGMLLVLLIYNIRSYVPFYSILCSLSFAHLIYALIWTRHKLNILDKRIEKINQSAAATENDHT